MFKIIRGLEVLKERLPFLIVAATNWKDQNIEIERFVLIIEHKKDPEAILLSLKTRISTRSGSLPKNHQFDLNTLLEEEILYAKQHYNNWLYEQMDDKAFTQIRNIVWQENNEIIPFALMYYKLEEKSQIKIIEIRRNTFCEELSNFIGSVMDLRLIIEEKDD